MADSVPVITGNNRAKKPGTFTKADPRINRKGRPRTFNAARELAQDIAHEPLAGDGGASVLNKRGEIQTRIEAILRTMSSSRNPKLIELFLAYAVGKPKDEIDITSKGEQIKGYAVISPDDWKKDDS